MRFGPNESTLDRIVRIVAAIALGAAALGGVVAAPVVYLAWVVVALLAITGIVGFCPLYAALRIGTKSAAR